MAKSDARIATGIGVVAVVAYVAFGWATDTAYDQYGRLGAAFLAGHWWLTDPPAWLTDLAACGDGRSCLVQPPLPALLVIPFLAVGSTAVAQGLAARILGGASAAPLYLALRAFGAPRLVALAGAALSAFGTTLLFSSVDSRAPYVAHSAAVLFSAVAFAVAASGGPAWGVGAAVGLAGLARPPVLLAAPALALLAARRTRSPVGRVLLGTLLGLAPFVAVYVGYDLVRWGSPFDLGYARLVADDALFSQGLFSPLYLLRHLYAILVAPPDLVETAAPFLRPRFDGMSLFLTTPAYLWVFTGLRRVRADGALAAVGLAALLALAPSVLGGAIGAPQFGYRFSLDAQPFLVALALSGDAAPSGVWRTRPSALFLAASLVAVVVNVYATVAIVRFGYWQ